MVRDMGMLVLVRGRVRGRVGVRANPHPNPNPTPNPSPSPSPSPSPNPNQVRDMGMLGSLLPPRALQQDRAVLLDSPEPSPWPYS
jgi:hypothetical protein